MNDCVDLNVFVFIEEIFFCIEVQNHSNSSAFDSHSAFQVKFHSEKFREYIEHH